MTPALIVNTICIRTGCQDCMFREAPCEARDSLVDWARRNDLVLYGPDPDTEGWRDALAEEL